MKKIEYLITMCNAFKMASTRLCTSKSMPILVMIILLWFTPAQANDIQVDNTQLVRGSNNRLYIEFDLSWENSWRVSTLGHGVGNWDAAWVFVKYRTIDGLWQHAWLSPNNNDHIPGTGTAATVNIGTTGIDDTPRGMGAFIYRSSNGYGPFNVTGARLDWDYTQQLDLNVETVEIKVFAIEMVYVAEGFFIAGSGGTESDRFTLTTIDTPDPTATPVGSDGFESSPRGGYPDGQTAPNLNWPNGYSAFYIMKYSISQQQYVDFLNTLTIEQANLRRPTGTSKRHGLNVVPLNEHSTTLPNVAMNWLTWMDAAAFADWAGLRPMTELEYEKAARGLSAPIPNEYAWGTTNINAATGLINPGDADETGDGAEANTTCCAQRTTSGGLRTDGPVRVGAYATGSSTREESGASYWGVMDLSGNVWERTVSIGDEAGRGFTGLHGDGTLSVEGNADVDNWPGLVSGQVTTGEGAGVRGGGWYTPEEMLRISDRTRAVNAGNGRNISGLTTESCTRWFCREGGNCNCSASAFGCCRWSSGAGSGSGVGFRAVRTAM